MKKLLTVVVLALLLANNVIADKSISEIYAQNRSLIKEKGTLITIKDRNIWGVEGREGNFDFVMACILYPNGVESTVIYIIGSPESKTNPETEIYMENYSPYHIDLNVIMVNIGFIASDVTEKFKKKRNDYLEVRNIFHKLVNSFSHAKAFEKVIPGKEKFRQMLDMASLHIIYLMPPTEKLPAEKEK